MITSNLDGIATFPAQDIDASATIKIVAHL
ncbi:hypothetical protein AB7M49_005914 [Bradyrhizobium elkanii]|nr:hypothetical protein [Bradyrhizobium elkanii]MCS4110255.1 hypothetical protein [Bradyrhizobium elkanii]